MRNSLDRLSPETYTATAVRERMPVVERKSAGALTVRRPEPGSERCGNGLEKLLWHERLGQDRGGAQYPHSLLTRGVDAPAQYDDRDVRCASRILDLPELSPAASPCGSRHRGALQRRWLRPLPPRTPQPPCRASLIAALRAAEVEDIPPLQRREALHSAQERLRRNFFLPVGRSR